MRKTIDFKSVKSRLSSFFSVSGDERWKYLINGNFISNRPGLIFLIALLSVSWFYDYHKIVFYPPQSIHYWRQSDNAMFAAAYAQEGMNFFKPQTFNLTSDNFETSYTSPGEIPLLYYLVAILYKIFGQHDFLFRGLNGLIFFIGLFYLFRIFKLYIQDVFWSIVLTLFIFSAPVIAFYALNYLADTTSLAFAFIGWYYILKFIKANRNRDFYIGIFILLFSTLFKILSGISLVALLIILLIEKFKITGLFVKNYQTHFNPDWYKIAVTLLSFLVIFIWSSYVVYYNSIHNSIYFRTFTTPIWRISQEDIDRVYFMVTTQWHKVYFNIFALYFILILYLVVLGFMGSIPKILTIISHLMLLGIISVLVLFFPQLHDHDYYLITLYIFIPFLLLGVFSLLNEKFPNVLKSWITKILFLSFLIYNISYSQQRLRNTYYGRWNYEVKQLFNDLYDIKPYLGSLGFTKDTRVLFTPDDSHYSLYLMNTKGWTDYTLGYYGFNYKKAIDALTRRGAEYLVVPNLSILYEVPSLNEFATDLAGKHKSVHIFRLGGKNENFVLPELNLVEEIRLVSDLFMIEKDLNPNLNLIRINEVEFSDEMAYNGNKSIKLSQYKQFAFTHLIESVKKGEKYEVSVKLSGDINNAHLIASGDLIIEFYKSSENGVSSDKENWIEKQLTFFVPELEVDKIKFHVWYNGPDLVYADDFVIKRYASYLQQD